MKIIVKSLKPLLKVFFFFFFCNSGDLSLICTQLKCHPPSFQSSPTFYLAGCSRQWSKISPTILQMSLFDGFENYPCLNAFVWLHGSYAIIPCLQMWFMHHHGIINHDKCYNCSTSKTIFHIQQDCELAWDILGISLFYFNLPHFFTMIDVSKIKWIIILVSFWLNKMLKLIVATRIYGFFPSMLIKVCQESHPCRLL